ncbi:MAG: hypothetical protein QOH58_384 [Thermoleophilaceae bacterium]|jgi:hypothetical protein|nr:hypothetical protein [Thermoleophilaceae bacterium]
MWKGRLRTRSGRAELGIELALLAAAGIFILWCGRGLTFLQDEWDFVEFRLGGDADAFLEPHNQHLLLVVAAVYKALFVTAGLDEYWPYLVVGATAHLLCVALLFEVARRRVGPALGAAVALPVLLMGSGWYVLVFPFNIQWSVAGAALCGIVLLLDREDPRLDPAVAALALLAIASASLGVVVAVGVAAAFAWARSWRRMWVPLLPLGLWLLWFIAYDAASDQRAGYRLSASPAYLFDTVAGAVAGFLGTPLELGAVAGRPWLDTGLHVLALVLVLALAAEVARRRHRITPQLALLLTTLAAYWAVLTVSRGYLDSPYQSNYTYVGVLLIVLVALELARGRAIRPPVAAAAALVCCAGAALNVWVLLERSLDRRHDARLVVADVSALEIARVPPDPAFQPDRGGERNPNVIAFVYYAATDRLDSSPADTPEELAREPEFARARADHVLTHAYEVEPARVNAGVRRVLAAVGGPGALARGCDRGQTVPGDTTPRDATLHSDLVVLRARPDAKLTLRARRFAHEFPDAPLAEVGGGPYLVSAPRGRAEQPWHLGVTSPKPVDVCPITPR